MPTGTVKWYDPDKGFGFVARDDSGDDLFLHHTMVGSESLADGDRISFTVGFGTKGERAEDIRVLERSGNPPRIRRPQGYESGSAYGSRSSGYGGGGGYSGGGYSGGGYSGGGYSGGGYSGGGNGERRPSVDPMTLPPMEGTVRRFDAERGFGFISSPNAADDVFFHGSVVIGGPVNHGDAVEFRLGEGVRGPRALQVRPLARDGR